MATKLRKRPCQTASFPELTPLGRTKDSRNGNTRNSQFQKRGERERTEREDKQVFWALAMRRKGRKKRQDCRGRFRSHGLNNGSNQCASSDTTLFRVIPNPPQHSSSRAIHVGRSFRLQLRWSAASSSPSPPAPSVVVCIRRLPRRSHWFVLLPTQCF